VPKRGQSRDIETSRSATAPGAHHLTTGARSNAERAAFVETIIDSAGGGIIVYDRDLRITVWNPFMEAITGLSAAQVLGRAAPEIFPEVMKAGVIDNLRQALAGGPPSSREFEYVVPETGLRGWVLGTYRPHEDENGNVIGVVASVLDISARREAELALARSEWQFRTLFDSIGDAVMITEPGGRFLEVNQVVLDRLGYTREEMLALPVAATMDPVSPEEEAKRQARIMSGAVIAFEGVRIKRDGTQFPVEIVSRRIEFHGRPAILSVCRDITERKRAEEATRNQARYLQQLVDAIPIPLIAKDLDGVIGLANVAFAEALRRKPEEVVGRRTADVGIAEADIHRLRDEALMRDGRVQTYELSTASPDGDRRIVFTKAPLRASDGGIEGIATAAMDITDRYQMEQELRRSEERFRALFENAADAIYIADTSGRILEVNQAACRMLDYGRDELLATNPIDLVTLHGSASLLEAIERLGRAGGNSFETVQTRRDGSRLPVEISVALIDLADRPAILAIARDISERTRAEEAIRAQALYLQQLVDGIPIPIIATEDGGRIRLANKAFMDIYRSRDVVGRTPAELGIDQGPHAQHVAAVLGGSVQTYETAVEANGTKRRIVHTMAPIRAADGAIQGIANASIDITERYEAEQAVRRSEELFRTLFENAADAIYIGEPSGRLIEANEAASRMLGFSREELLSMGISELDTPEAAVLLPNRVAQLMARGRLSFETAHRRKDGTAVPIEVSAAMIDLGGRPAILAIARDVSERNRLEEQLRQAQKMEGIGQLAGGIAHDFNNLMTAVRGNASLALMSLPDDSPAREELGQIEQAADRAAALTRQLLAFARRSELKPEVIDLSAVVGRLVPMLQRLLGEDVALVTRSASLKGRVLADPSKIEQVIVNLAVNARDAMPDGGELTIEVADAQLDDEFIRQHRLATPGHNVLLAVSDTGTGMDEATMGHLFEPFFTTKAPGQGTGLGLATVDGIVKQSGGCILTDSEPGKGSTFRVYLPSVGHSPTRPREPQQAPAVPAPPCRTGTILVVEDEPSVRSLACKLLERAGYRVIAAATGAEALEVDPQEVDLLLTDVVMPSMSGREVADRLAARRPDLQVLFMSGHADRTIVKHGVLDPTIRYLPKPFTAQTLVEAVDAAISDGKAAEGEETRAT
jgi:two-component system cell cycle sensor histidine kinase/response regulator CckA